MDIDIYIYTSTFIYPPRHLYIDINIYLYTSTFIHRHRHLYISTSTFVYLPRCLYISTSTYTSTSIYPPRHIYINLDIYISTLTFIYPPRDLYIHLNIYIWMVIIIIITLLTQVRKEKNGKINFRPGIEPGTQRLGVQYTRHQAITQDKSLSPHSSLCTASGRWRICQPHTDRPPNN